MIDELYPLAAIDSRIEMASALVKFLAVTVPKAGMRWIRARRSTSSVPREGPLMFGGVGGDRDEGSHQGVGGRQPAGDSR